MFSKEERKAMNTAFWTGFKEKAGVNKGIHGRRINWVNYPTQLKQIYIRLHADSEHARFSIDIQDKDDGVRELIWEQFTELKKVLEQEMILPGTWEENAFNSAGQSISRISWTQEGVNMFTTKDQHRIYDFFIMLLVRFDRFYSAYDDVLIGLIK